MSENSFLIDGDSSNIPWKWNFPRDQRGHITFSKPLGTSETICGLVPKAYYFASGVPSWGKGPHIKRGMEQAIEKDEFWRALAVCEVWPHLTQNPLHAVLVRHESAVLCWGGTFVSLSEIGRAPSISPPNSSQDTHSFVRQNASQLTEIIRRRWAPPTRAVIKAWLRASHAEKFWMSVQSDGIDTTILRECLEALCRLYAFFAPPDFEKNFDHVSDSHGSPGPLLFELVEEEGAIGYNISRFVLGEACEDVATECALRLLAWLLKIGNLRPRSEAWIETNISKLQLAPTLINLEYGVPLGSVSAHDAAEAMLKLSCVLRDVPQIENILHSFETRTEPYPVPDSIRLVPIMWGQTIDNILPRYCGKCRHFSTGFNVCTAFPRGIPHSIYFGRHDHKLPFEGDGGLRFEPRSSAAS